MAKKENMLVFSAHTDDFVIGAGGTIAEFGKDKEVTILILSYGEMSHPWLKGKVAKNMRAKEALEAGKILNCKIQLFDLKEGNFTKEFSEQLSAKLVNFLETKKPLKIFTHSSEDPHPDHRATYKITLELAERVSYKPEVYTYSVWNPVSFRSSYPSLYVNISKTFAAKLKALKAFKSQKIHVAYPFCLLLFRAFWDGLKIKGGLMGEKFFRIK